MDTNNAATAVRINWETLKQEVIAAAPDLGIDAIGFAAADPFLSLKKLLEEHRAKGYESGFEEPDIEKRVYPALDDAVPASLISIAVAYPSKMKDPPRSEPGKYRGILSRSAWGRDYHEVLREAMSKLEAYLRDRVPGAVIKSMVDTGELVDRAVAERAGIGFSGKNCAIISPELGSWIYLGELVTNIPFQPDQPVTEGCGECTKCIDACPTGALVGPGELNAQRCISFLTQTKGFLDEEFMKKIGNRLYGCDTCQIVCPKNKGKHWDRHPELTPDPEIVKPLLLPLLDLSNREFKERFGQSAAAWRGKKPIQRNAVIALGNFKDKSAVPKLTEVLLHDPRPELRGTAAWSLSQIGGESAMRAVQLATEKEQHEQVLDMLDRAISRLRGEEDGAVTKGKGGTESHRVAEHEHTAAEYSQASEALLTANIQNGNTPPGEASAESQVEDRGDSINVGAPTPAVRGTVNVHRQQPDSSPVYYDELHTPIGILTLCATEQGLCRVEFGAFQVQEAVLQQWARTWIGDYTFIQEPERLAEASNQLNAYFAGSREAFELPLDIKGTPFQLQVWGALADIPYGDVVSYTTIAQRIDRPKAVRAVGGANNKNPLPIIIPCHRVGGADGRLVGYAGGLQVKTHLLDLEQSRTIR